MELRHLASFLAVVEEGQFTRAAARLFLSPPAVTAHIQQLERDLGTRLLSRSPVALTPAGQRLVPHARAMLAASAAATEAVADLRDDRQPTLRVGVMGHGSAELTPAILHAFRRARPDIALVMETLDFTEHITALIDQRVDVAFVRPAPDDDRIAVDVMTTEPRIVVLPAASPLADAGALRIADILDLPFLDVPDRAPRVFTDYLYFTASRGDDLVRRSPDQALTPHEVLVSAAAGRGVGSALYSWARYYPWPGTRCVPILDAPWERSVLATRAADARPAVRTFRTIAGRLARDLGPTLVPVPRLPGV